MPKQISYRCDFCDSGVHEGNGGTPPGQIIIRQNFRSEETAVIDMDDLLGTDTRREKLYFCNYECITNFFSERIR